MNMLDIFIKSIERKILLSKFGLLTAEEFTQKSQELNLRDKIIETMLNVVSDSFSSEKKQEFEGLVEKGDQEAIVNFYTETIQQIPDLNNLMLQSFEKLGNSI